MGNTLRGQRAGRADSHKAHQRDRHVSRLRQVDPVLQGPASQAQPVEQRRGE